MPHGSPFASRASVDEQLALRINYIVRRLDEISRESEELKQQLIEARDQQHDRVTRVTAAILQEIDSPATAKSTAG
jgi:predicted transcriptional regulator